MREVAQFRRRVEWVSVAVLDVDFLCYGRDEVVQEERQGASVASPAVWSPWASLWFPQVCCMLERWSQILVQGHVSPKNLSSSPGSPQNSLLSSTPGLGI